ncbi:GNAT family N-acetyltransferase [Salipaludibacillus sp. CUR1]|uniref:GNAT family N-acetyltransferase n=1 Tax=Salipaludibacillus sp. CUR1 TaxID=2820003 RepID=UPI001E55DA5E|nr:GNAT family protein [Salipaludibacillus sp. CUR1]MCE7791109.1 GNAT family N-acetyltransferase [Salipaludibacillus sp. CUR1]
MVKYRKIFGEGEFHLTNEVKYLPQIVTKHYTLRGLEETDAEALFPILSNKKTMAFITPHPVNTLTELKESVAESRQKFQRSEELPWVITANSTEEVIGLFRFHKLNLWHKKAEMGAVIRSDRQGTGVMTEVLPAVLICGFKNFNLNRIVGDIFADNKGSQKLLEKYGFHKEGTLRQTDFDGHKYHDTVVYSLLKAEFEKLNTY